MNKNTIYEWTSSPINQYGKFMNGPVHSNSALIHEWTGPFMNGQNSWVDRNKELAGMSRKSNWEREEAPRGRKVSWPNLVKLLPIVVLVNYVADTRLWIWGRVHEDAKDLECKSEKRAQRGQLRTAFRCSEIKYLSYMFQIHAQDLWQNKLTCSVGACHFVNLET